MSLLDPSLVRHGRVNGRYFRENFAQGGIDLVQIVPELVTNADSAIARGGRPSGRIVLRFGAPDPDFAAEWKRAMRRLRAPALLEWRHELRCTTTGRDGRRGGRPAARGARRRRRTRSGQRGLFGRGLRDVWLAQGGGRIEGVHEGRLVESWFFPSGGDDPYAYVHVRDEEASAAARAQLGLDGSGTRITVPLAARAAAGQRAPAAPGRPARAAAAGARGSRARAVARAAGRAGRSSSRCRRPSPTAERPLLFDDEIEVGARRAGAGDRAARGRADPAQPVARDAARRAGDPLRARRARDDARRSRGRAGHAAPLRRGDLRGDRAAPARGAGLAAPAGRRQGRPLRAQRAPPVRAAPVRGVERVLRPIVAAEERRAGAHLVRAGRAVQARDQVGLRALNDALRNAFDAPGTAGFERGGAPADAPARVEPGA